VKPPRAHEEERVPCNDDIDIRIRATNPTVKGGRQESDRSRSRDGRVLALGVLAMDRNDGGYARSPNRNAEALPTIDNGGEDFSPRGGRNGRLSAPKPITINRRADEPALSLRSRDERGATPSTIVRQDEKARDSGLAAGKFASKRHEGTSRSQLRNGRAETSRIKSTHPAGVRPEMRTTRSKEDVDNGPREGHRSYTPSGRERSLQAEADDLRRQFEEEYPSGRERFLQDEADYLRRDFERLYASNRSREGTSRRRRSYTPSGREGSLQDEADDLRRDFERLYASREGAGRSRSRNGRADTCTQATCIHKHESTRRAGVRRLDSPPRRVRSRNVAWSSIRNLGLTTRTSPLRGFVCSAFSSIRSNFLLRTSGYGYGRDDNDNYYDDSDDYYDDSDDDYNDSDAEYDYYDRNRPTKFEF